MCDRAGYWHSDFNCLMNPIRRFQAGNDALKIFFFLYRFILNQNQK